MKNKNTSSVESADFREAVELLSIYTSASQELEALETKLNQCLICEVDQIKGQYALFQSTLQEAESKLELIALRHPEWFGEKKSVKTPYGELKFHKSSPLEVKNEEVSVVLIEARLTELAALLETATPGEIARLAEEQSLLTSFLRRETHLDLDSLGKCDESLLKKFRISRTEKQNFSIKAAKIDLGKAVKAAAKQEMKEAA